MPHQHSKRPSSPKNTPMSSQTRRRAPSNPSSQPTLLLYNPSSREYSAQPVTLDTKHSSASYCSPFHSMGGLHRLLKIPRFHRSSASEPQDLSSMSTPVPGSRTSLQVQEQPSLRKSLSRHSRRSDVSDSQRPKPIYRGPAPLKKSDIHIFVDISPNSIQEYEGGAWPQSGVVSSDQGPRHDYSSEHYAQADTSFADSSFTLSDSQWPITPPATASVTTLATPKSKPTSPTYEFPYPLPEELLPPNPYYERLEREREKELQSMTTSPRQIRTSNSSSTSSAYPRQPTMTYTRTIRTSFSKPTSHAYPSLAHSTGSMYSSPDTSFTYAFSPDTSFTTSYSDPAAGIDLDNYLPSRASLEARRQPLVSGPVRYTQTPALAPTRSTSSVGPPVLPKSATSSRIPKAPAMHIRAPSSSAAIRSAISPDNTMRMQQRTRSSSASTTPIAQPSIQKIIPLEGSGRRPPMLRQQTATSSTNNSYVGATASKRNGRATPVPVPMPVASPGPSTGALPFPKTISPTRPTALVSSNESSTGNASVSVAHSTMDFSSTSRRLAVSTTPVPIPSTSGIPAPTMMSSISAGPRTRTVPNATVAVPATTTPPRSSSRMGRQHHPSAAPPRDFVLAVASSPTGPSHPAQPAPLRSDSGQSGRPTGNNTLGSATSSSRMRAHLGSNSSSIPPPSSFSYPRSASIPAPIAYPTDTVAAAASPGRSISGTATASLPSASVGGSNTVVSGTRSRTQSAMPVRSAASKVVPQVSLRA